MVVSAWNQPNLGFTTSADLLSNIGAMNTPYVNPGLGNNEGNTYYVGEGAFHITVSQMTTKECKGIVLEALESL